MLNYQRVNWCQNSWGENEKPQLWWRYFSNGKLGHFLAIDGNCKLSTWILLVGLPKNYIELSRHLKKSPQSPHFSHGNDGLQSTCPCVAAQPLGPLSERGSSATPHWTSVEWHPSMRLTTGGKNWWGNHLSRISSKILRRILGNHLSIDDLINGYVHQSKQIYVGAAVFVGMSWKYLKVWS